MTSPGAEAVQAVHIGADVVACPPGTGWPRLLSCRDTVDRLSRLSHAAGARSQHRAVGPDATVATVRRMVTGAVARTRPGGLLIVAFSGHSERAVPGVHDGGWYLYDGSIRHVETAALLSAAPPSATVVVIADTCYATALAHSPAMARVPATVVLLAACAESQTTLNYPVSEFVTTLHRLTFPGGKRHPDCVTYTWLRRQLRVDTPDAQRPEVWVNRVAAWRLRPFESASAVRDVEGWGAGAGDAVPAPHVRVADTPLGGAVGGAEEGGAAGTGQQLDEFLGCGQAPVPVVAAVQRLEDAGERRVYREVAPVQHQGRGPVVPVVVVAGHSSPARRQMRVLAPPMRPMEP